MNSRHSHSQKAMAITFFFVLSCPETPALAGPPFDHLNRDLSSRGEFSFGSKNFSLLTTILSSSFCYSIRPSSSQLLPPRPFDALWLPPASGWQSNQIGLAASTISRSLFEASLGEIGEIQGLIPIGERRERPTTQGKSSRGIFLWPSGGLHHAVKRNGCRGNQLSHERSSCQVAISFLSLLIKIAYPGRFHNRIWLGQ
jgi:hypothetical protein